MTYKYKCENKHIITAIQRITDKPLKRCIKCGKKVTRIIQKTSFILNGPGWAKSGYSK